MICDLIHFHVTRQRGDSYGKTQNPFPVHSYNSSPLWCPISTASSLALAHWLPCNVARGEKSFQQSRGGACDLTGGCVGDRVALHTEIPHPKRAFIVSWKALPPMVALTQGLKSFGSCVEHSPVRLPCWGEALELQEFQCINRPCQVQ